MERLQLCLQDLLNIAKCSTNQFSIIVIGNIKANQLEYEAELFDDEEFVYINNSLRGFGFYTQYYYDEIKFIEDMQVNQDENIIIYNLSRSGHEILKKGIIPYYCNIRKLEYLGSDFYTIALTKHKYHSMMLLSCHNISVAHSWLFQIGKGWLIPPPYGTRIINKAGIFIS